MKRKNYMTPQTAEYRVETEVLMGSNKVDYIPIGPQP